MSLEPELLERMSNLPHFKGLTHSELARILADGRLQPYPTEVTLFQEGEPCAGVFVLVSGEVQLWKTGPDGREHIMGVVQPITMFNEVSVLDGGPNPATAVTTTDCMIWHASRTHFNHQLERHPQIAMGLLPIMAARNRWLVSQYEDLSFRSVKARMAKLLLELSENGRLSINRRQHPIHELAARIATVPEAVSRSLSEFTRLEYIQTSRTRITVLDTSELVLLAQLSPDLPN